MDFRTGPIEGVTVTPLRKHIDDRGWLVETFRHDEIDGRYHPQMGYTSLTLPGIVRGPHEHAEQSDLFLFFGPGNFKIWLWDNRKESATYWNRQVLFGGIDRPIQLLVPPGVVHAYKNASSEPAIVHNFPNQLFMGENRKREIDEIRHEADPDTAFRVDE